MKKTTFMFALAAAMAVSACSDPGPADVGSGAPSTTAEARSTPTTVSVAASIVPSPDDGDLLDASALEDPYPCGYGFYLGAQDQTAGIFFIVEYDAGAVSAGTTELPTAQWRAEVRTGRDLFANWCDDVIEPDEPVAMIDATWQVSSGVLQIDQLPDFDECGPASGSASSIVITGDDGLEIELGDFDLTNEAWGCFAG